MTQITPALRTGYSLARCALGMAEPHLRTHLPHTLAKCARLALAASDVVETAYVSWQVIKELFNRDEKLMGADMGADKTPTRIVVDYTVRGGLLFGTSALVVTTANRFLTPPQISLADLLQGTRAAQEVAAGTLTASFSKSLPETCIATLGVANALLQLSHAYLTSSRAPLGHAALRTLGIWRQLTDYRTLEITHTMSPFTAEWLKKKVEVVFYLNSAGLSKEKLIEKLLSIYDYSTKVFNNLKAVPNYRWIQSGTYDKGYYHLVMQWLPSPAPLIHRIRILLTGSTEVVPFQLIDVLRLIPRFWVPAVEASYPDSWRRVELVEDYVNYAWRIRQLL